jgi:two-component system, sensor histidine kinase RpfC
LNPRAPQAPLDRSVLNLGMLEDLVMLGGDTFVREVMDTFIADSAQHLEDLQHDAAWLDASRFRDKLHALRSSGANVGASGLVACCGKWQTSDYATLEADGPEIVRQLSEEVQAARDALLQWQASRPVQFPRSA